MPILFFFLLFCVKKKLIIKNKIKKQKQFYTKLKKYTYIKRNSKQGGWIHLNTLIYRGNGYGKSATGDKSRWMPWITLRGVFKRQSPGFFQVFWEWRWKCVGMVCSHLCGYQCLLFLGAAAGLEKSRVNDHLPKPSLIDNPTAHLLPAGGEINK